MPKRSPRTTTRKATRKRPAPKPGGQRKLNRRQVAWLAASERLFGIDADTYAGIVDYLRNHATAQEKRRYHYIDLRGARGIAKVEATLKGG